jgi:flagellar assembly factor FliW
MTLPLTVEQAVPTRRQIRSELFGTLDITEDELIEFSDGLLGFPTCRSWALLRGTKDGTAWLQSAEHATLVFLLVDPFVFFDGYSAELSPGELHRLKASDSSEIAVFAIVTLPGAGTDTCTANLQGPVVLNLVSRRGVQVVFGEGPFGIRAPIALEALL